MATSYTNLLGLALPVTGELSGTWGDTVNNYISNYIDAAVAGAQTVTTDTTLTKTTGASLSGTSSQYAIIIASPASANITITAPAASKIYTIINTSATYTVKIVGAGPTTGVTLGVSEKAQVAWNGSDFVRIGASGGPGVFSSITNTGLTSGRVVYSTAGGLETDSANLLFNGTTLTANTLNLTNALTTAYGGTGLTAYTAGDLPYYAAGTVLSKLTIGTAGQILTSSGTAPQWSTLSGVAVTSFSAGTTGFTPSSATAGAVTLAGTLATTNGGTGLTSFTANGVVYASSTSALATGSALTFDGTLFSSTVADNTISVKFKAASSNIRFIPQDGGAAKIAALNGAESAWYPLVMQASNHQWVIDTTEGMRLTSTGLGIGTSSPTQKLNVNGIALFEGAAQGNIIIQKTGTNGVSLFSDAAGKLAFYDQNAGVTRLTLDSSGNLGIGTTSPNTKLELRKDTTTAGSEPNILLNNRGTNTTYTTAHSVGGIYGASFRDIRDPGYIAGINFYRDSASGGVNSSGSILFYTLSDAGTLAELKASERMRLDSSGNLLVGTTSTLGAGVVLSPSASAPLVGVTGSASSGGSTYTLYSTGASAYRFYVDFGGNINATSIVITAISDQRLKENVRDIDTGLDAIMALKPRRFDWKEGKGQDKKDVAGFIAQEFETVFPECVGTSKAGADGIEYKNINHETLIPTLVKAIQEQQAIINQLKARLDAANL